MIRIAFVSTLLSVFLVIGVPAQKVDETTVNLPAADGPVSYGLVVDNSGSFRLLLDKVIRLVADIVKSNRPDDEAFLVTFIDSPKINLRQDFTAAKGDLNDAAENMFIEGGQTAILDAVKFSADYMTAHAKGAAGRQRVMILITDGDERKSTATIEEVVRVLKEGNIKVFVVGLADGKIYPKLLDRLTKETGGSKYLPRTRDEIAEAVKGLTKAIRSK